MKASRKKIITYSSLLLLVIIVAVLGVRYYRQHISATRIAFINFSEVKLSRISKSNPSGWIDLDVLTLDALDDVRDYDAVFIFGRGFNMSPAQKEALQQAGYAGVPLFVEAATNPNMDVTNLQGEALDQVTDYFQYGGTTNYTNLLAYARQHLDGKTWFAEAPQPPKVVPQDVFIHLDEQAVFENYQDYDAYYKTQGFYKAGRPTVAVLTSVPGPFNANRDHIDSLISMLERRNLNVYTISARNKRLDFLKAVNPDLAIFMPHGRLTLGREAEATAWLKEKNIPLLTPISVFQAYEDWVADPQGFVGPLLTMNVVLPEIDGGINPYAINAQFKDENGYLSFQAIPDRLEKFGDMVEKWLALKAIPNHDKKVAIYYFKGPGLNAMVAANMEVVPSLYNTLVRLQHEGYRVENLPPSAHALWEMIKKQGAVLGPYAQGAFDEFLAEGNPALVAKEDYEAWVAQDLPAANYQAVTDKYGEAPGEYLSTRQAGKDYLAVARLQFGNVVLLPQPLAGVGDDTFQIIHGAKAAPPHPYIAAYLWTRHVFQPDAIIHWGTHGSLEFTPGKQVALSEYDWADALIGVTPHLYVYTISNVGEGIIAKRRTYATTLTYLTPPFMEADVTGDLKQLSDKLTAFVGTNGIIREHYRSSIGQLVIKLGLQVDLGLDSTGVYDDATMMRLSDHVEEIRNAKITGGLYTLGQPYTAAQTDHTARLMAIDPMAYSLAALDKLQGRVTQAQLDNAVYFDQHYRQRAHQAIMAITQQHQPAEAVLSTLVPPAALETARQWQARTRGVSDADIVKGFIGLGSSRARGKRGGGQPNTKGAPTEEEVAAIKQRVIAIAPYPERVEFIRSLQSDKQFKQRSGLLDPQTLAKAKNVAKAVPAMAKALEIGQQPDVYALLKMMQKESLRQLTFTLLDDESLADQVAAEKERAQQQILDSLTAPAYVQSLTLLNQPAKLAALSTPQLTQHLAHLKYYAQHAALVETEAPSAVMAHWPQTQAEQALQNTIDQIALALSAAARKEADYAQAVLTIAQAVRSVNQYRQDLTASTDAELQAILTGLQGGYIPPSSGGDPITNPATVPTGRNLYAIDAEKTPSPEAWRVGVELAQTLLQTHFEKHQAYPKKVSFSLWAGDFIGTEGATVGQILYLLGVEPVRDPFNRVVDIKLIPAQQLGRPRIDVVVQTSGQFRDLAASRMFLINKAVRMAAEADDADSNFVKDGVQTAEITMKEKGLSPQQAHAWASQRVFGGINGSYGTNIMAMVESGNRWENEQQVAQTYLHNMGALYDEGGNWGAFQEGVFEAALQNTEVVVQPRDNNAWGGLSLDHVYEFMGGMSLAVRTVTGEDPDAYFNDFRNPTHAKVQALKEALWVEARSTLLNPKYIEEYMQGGATSAEKFAETFRNTYGWNVMKPAEIDDALWNDLHDVYIKDALNLNVHEFFRRENPYALQEMTAVMLEAVRKGYWQASPRQIKELAALHTDLIKTHRAGCSGFVCDNDKLQTFIEENITDEARVDYQAALQAVKEPQAQDGVVLEKESLQKQQQEAAPDIQSLSGVIFTVIGLMVLLIVFLVIKRKRQA